VIDQLESPRFRCTGSREVSPVRSKHAGKAYVKGSWCVFVYKILTLTHK